MLCYLHTGGGHWDVEKGLFHPSYGTSFFGLVWHFKWFKASQKILIANSLLHCLIYKVHLQYHSLTLRIMEGVPTFISYQLE